MSGTRDEKRIPDGHKTPDDQRLPEGVSEDAGEIEGLGLQPGAEDEQVAQPQDPPEELEEERRG